MLKGKEKKREKSYLPLTIAVSNAQTLTAIIAFSGLVVAFVSLVWQIISKIQEDRIKIEVYQRGSSIGSRVEWSEGFTFVTLETVVVNVSPKATAVITSYSIKLPWNDEHFDLLPDPGEDQDYPDSYPESAYSPLKNPRNDVLNHRILEQGTLTPSKPVIRGLLIGRGVATIPAHFRNAQDIDVIVSVYDQRGKKHSGKFKARVSKWEQDLEIPPNGEELMRRRL